MRDEQTAISWKKQKPTKKQTPSDNAGATAQAETPQNYTSVGRSEACFFLGAKSSERLEQRHRAYKGLGASNWTK